MRWTATLLALLALHMPATVRFATLSVRRYTWGRALR